MLKQFLGIFIKKNIELNTIKKIYKLLTIRTITWRTVCIIQMHVHMYVFVCDGTCELFANK